MSRRLICHIIGIISLGILLLHSCTTAKQLTCFNSSESSVETVMRPNFKISSGDELSIKVYAVAKEAVKPYNLSTEQGLNSIEHLYRVDNAGEITFPILGKVQVGGKSEQEAEQLLTEQISTQVKDAMVTVRIANAKVTVLGEVNCPKTIDISQPVSLIEALGEAGGLTANGRRDNILVIRAENGRQTMHRVNIQSADIFKSAYYWLQKGDAVYVSPKSGRNSKSIRVNISNNIPQK